MKFLLLVTISVFLVGCGSRPTSVGSQLKGMVDGAKDGDILLLTDAPKNVNGFPMYESIYVFAPGTSSADINKSLGFGWKEGVRYKLASRTDINLAVFTNGKSVVESEEWPRSDFEVDPSLIGVALCRDKYSFVQVVATCSPRRITVNSKP